MSDVTRQQIADAQRRLLDALSGGSVPAGFDAARLNLTARTLRNKRARSLALRWPALSRIPNFDTMFDAFVAAVPKGDGDSDGERFFGFARSNGKLPEPAVVEWLIRRAKRRGFATTRLDESRRRVFAVRLPWPPRRVVWFRV